ncbi:MULTISPECIES: hypothetical protein [Bacteroidaceae]|uniref:hypothetical protein n=1 Tax=Bacteroidaceae TaxID=815 RepID=UPI001897097D|nr:MULTISPECIES: hypothetical protein [Bacteroidaceae]MDB1026745.1 hypothetical protein [Phocaeicola vulgatus]
MSRIDLNALRDGAYKTACEHGFHDQELSNEHYFCLVISELMEAMEADRKGRLGKKSKSRFEMNYNRYPALVEEEKRFKCSFEANVKDTLPDELADAVIRLLDLAGLRGINLELANGDIDDCIEDMAESCKDETFTESIYAISTLPVRYDGLYDFHTTINDMVLSIFGLAKHLEIDLLWHIEQKMKYNKLRDKMHGKKY